MSRRKDKAEKLRRIVKALKEADRSLWPKEVAFRTGIQPSTVRVYLRELLKAGVVLQPERGLYVINPTYGVGRPPRIHNLWLSARAFIKRGSRKVEEYGDCKIQVILGAKRNRITGVISSSEGLDFTSCFFAIQRFKGIVKEILGLELQNSDIWVRNCEFNEDYVGIRLEGLNCVTVKSFLGTLERLYNKPEGLRSEVKVKPDSLESILALLKGGITPYYAVQGVFMVEKRIEQLVEAIKWQNQGIQKLQNIMLKLLEKLEK